MLEANSNAKLQEKGITLAYRADLYDAENGIHSQYAYLDPECVAFESEEFIEINENGDVYGFNNEDKIIYRYLFLDDSAKYRVIEITGFVGAPNETVIEESVEDGDLVVITMDQDPDNLACLEDNLAYYGYEVTGPVTCINKYYLDPETYEIKHSAVYVNTGNEEILYVENSRIEEPEVYEIPEELTEAINAKDVRTVTVIADPGTDDETVYVQTIARGCSVRLFASEEHPNFYTDEACTQPFTGGVDPNVDLILYTIRE